MDPRHQDKWKIRYLVTWTTTHSNREFRTIVTLMTEPGLYYRQSIKDIPRIISRQRTGSDKAAKFIDIICLETA